MFGLFKARPPLGPWEKAWTEDRMSWFAEQFGISRLLETPTLITDYAGIPEVFDEASANELLRFLQTWMKLDELHAHVYVSSDVASVDLASPNSTRIVVHERSLIDRQTLVASMARQLSQAALAAKESRHPMDDWTIDLFPAFLGLGLFAANASIRSDNQPSQLDWAAERKHGYLPARIFGYAIALRAFARSDHDHAWCSNLRPDAQTSFLEGIKFLEKTRDTTFSRDLSTKPRHRMSTETMLQELQLGSPSRKVAVMWELQRRIDAHDGRPDERVSELVLDCIRHREADVRATAATVLPTLDRSQLAAVALADALRDSNHDVRAAAANALAHFAGVDDETIVHDLTDALADDVRLVTFSAARTLTFYGRAAEPATKMLLKRLRRALVECRDDDASMIMGALHAIIENPKARVEEYFSDADTEYRDFSIQLIEQLEAS